MPSWFTVVCAMFALLWMLFNNNFGFTTVAAAAAVSLSRSTPSSANSKCVYCLATGIYVHGFMDMDKAVGTTTTTTYAIDYNIACIGTLRRCRINAGRIFSSKRS